MFIFWSYFFLLSLIRFGLVKILIIAIRLQVDFKNLSLWRHYWTCLLNVWFQYYMFTRLTIITIWSCTNNYRYITLDMSLHVYIRFVHVWSWTQRTYELLLIIIPDFPVIRWSNGCTFLVKSKANRPYKPIFHLATIWQNLIWFEFKMSLMFVERFS